MATFFTGTAVLRIPALSLVGTDSFKWGEGTTMRQRIIFGILMVVLTSALIEGSARFAHRWVYGGGYSRELFAPTVYGLAIEDHELPQQGPPDEKLSGYHEILHPYFGYTGDVEYQHRQTHGFHLWPTPLPKRETGRKQIALVGGSVAFLLAPSLQRVAQDRWAEVDPGVEVSVLNLSRGGYKQPQQLTTISYLLSLGAEYDVVVNVDGYNEAVLPLTENYRAGVYPFFPRMWSVRLQNRPSGEQLRRIGRANYLHELSRSLRESVATSFWAFSAAPGLIARIALDRLQATATRADEQAQAAPPQKSLEVRGPYRYYESEKDLQAEMVNVWQRSSELLADLARSNAADYLHVLQPNQYLEGSKLLSSTELSYYWRPGENARLVREIYPLMIARAPELIASGVRFIDATDLFAGIEETIYTDVCCHFNEVGLSLLAELIMDGVLRRPESGASSPGPN